MDRPPKHVVMVREAELLGVTAGRVEGRPVAILSVRLDPAGSYAPTNIAVPKEQAYRLAADLVTLFETADTFNEE
ncbi:MAG TPA: hypothetical protein VFG68_10950 [Fimbriiglobus sp.]|nr:hypothetical protein [Fimbriiglobus sp.]